MPKRKKNTPIDKFEESTAAKKGLFRWQMMTLLASVITFISLFGVWYTNNEKAFLQIENKKLAVETENLKEEIKVLQNAIVEKDNQAGDAAKPDETATENQPAETKPAGNQPAESQQAEISYEEYTIQPGDTLGGISVSLFGSESYISKITELNGLSAESILQVGQKIKIPKKTDA